MQVVQEALGALRVVKAFGQEDGECDRFSRRSGTGVRARIRLAMSEGTFGLLVNLVMAVGTAAVLFLGVIHVQRGVLTLGELLMVIAYLSQLYSPLKTISKRMATLQSSMASAERVFEFLDEPFDVPQPSHPVRLGQAQGLVEFQNVWMSYDGEQHTLRDVSFRVEPRAHVGIYGMTGAGKTTLVSLLVRFFDPAAGRVLLDGVDLRRYRLDDLRRQVSFVLQDPVLFSTSIAENIRYARPDASLDEVMAAAELADAHQFIKELPSGYDTLVGERGMRLSGGERPRISLARVPQGRPDPRARRADQLGPRAHRGEDPRRHGAAHGGSHQLPDRAPGVHPAELRLLPRAEGRPAGGQRPSAAPDGRRVPRGRRRRSTSGALTSPRQSTVGWSVGASPGSCRTIRRCHQSAHMCHSVPPLQRLQW